MDGIENYYPLLAMTITVPCLGMIWRVLPEHLQYPDLAYTSMFVGVAILAYCLSIVWHALSRYIRFRLTSRKTGCKPAPSYSNLDPFLGLDLFLKLRRADGRGQRSRAYRDLHTQLGRTFEMKCCSSTEIQTAQPENIQAVCATDFESFGVGPMRGGLGAPFLDRGIFTEDGPYWKHSRALIRPTFNRSEIADLGNFEKHVARFVALLPRDGSTFDLQPLVKRLFIDTSTEFIFGKSTESLLPEAPAEIREFMQAFDWALLGLALRITAGPLKPLFVFDPTWKPQYRKVHAFVDKQVKDALERRALIDATGKAPPAESARKKYILLDEMVKQSKDPYELRNQVINVFFPARDSIAFSFGNIMFELARHPQYWDQLRREALDFGDRPLTFESLKEYKITKAVISETLRLHLAASRVARIALRDTVLPVGGGSDCRAPLFVPKGRIVDMDLHTLQRDPTVWGAAADEFRPERWLGERALWEGKWQYEPFLGGPRMCPAQQQVLTQLSYLLVRLAKEFVSIENRDPVAEYVEEIKMNIESRNGVKIGLIPVG